MNETMVTWEVVWRLRQRGCVPAFNSRVEYESNELKNLCHKWCELQKQQDEIDKRFKAMAEVDVDDDRDDGHPYGFLRPIIER